MTMPDITKMELMTSAALSTAQAIVKECTGEFAAALAQKLQDVVNEAMRTQKDGCSNGELMLGLATFSGGLVHSLALGVPAPPHLTHTEHLQIQQLIFSTIMQKSMQACEKVAKETAPAGTKLN